jgi:hypothetical protein
MRRVGLGLLALGLAGCSSGSAPTQAAGAEHIACALAGAQQFTPDCAVERLAKAQDGDDVVLVRHPDGGFRRFVLIDGGTRIATADGVAEVQAVTVGPDLEVTVEQDRYRFPSAKKPNAS